LRIGGQGCFASNRRVRKRTFIEGTLRVDGGGVGEEFTEVEAGGDLGLELGLAVAGEPTEDLVDLGLRAALPLGLGDVQRIDAGERGGVDPVFFHSVGGHRGTKSFGE